MEQTHVQLDEIKLIGKTVRTNNANEADPMNMQNAKIFPVVQQYFQQALMEKIPNRVKPYTTYCAYTNYESDHTGDYTYFIGEAVSSHDEIPEGFEAHTIPSQHYAKFTNGPAPMPEVIREPWQAIWTMTDDDFGGKRHYHTDFEIYDERAADHSNIVLDIFIGIETK